MEASWKEVLEQPALGDHIVQIYEDTDFLSEAVAHYLSLGLKAGEAAIVVARPEHWEAFATALAAQGIDAAQRVQSAQLRVLDAESTLGLFMRGGMPDWTSFHRAVGGEIAELRLRHPSVRAYGEMVDILWQGGERDAAIRLEEHWNELARLQTFSLFCAYRMDPLDAELYGGALQRVCGVHSHLIPARDTRRFNDTVAQATRKVLGWPLSEVLGGGAGAPLFGAQMPSGQAALLWMHKHMPLTARKILAEAKARTA